MSDSPSADSSTKQPGEPRAAGAIEAPTVDYLPRDPAARPGIGLIGCGGITRSHLAAYRKAGYRVVALCDVDRARAQERQAEFYPDATVHTDHRELLGRDDVEVVDVATHPRPRVAIVRDAIEAGRHVLSQKPFVLDLDTGEELVALADRKGVRLAVNQNGRWAPHFSYMRRAIASGHIGTVMSAHLGVHWDHGWTAGTPFDELRHLVLYDFAIHWFDILAQFMRGRAARRVFASMTRAPGQRPKPPCLAQVLIEYDDAQATLVFDAAVPYGPLDHTFIAGTEGTLRASGPSLTEQTVTLTTERGKATPVLEGNWTTHGFHGTMAELLCAIEENREPENSARDNLASLAICFAAMKSADTGQPQTPGQVRTADPFG